MLTSSPGSIFNSRAIAYVNPVNAVGISGAGLAKSFKDKFPNNFKVYAEYCNFGKMVPGGVFLYDNKKNPKYIFNVATKGHFRERSSYQHIQNILDRMVELVREFKIKSIAMPMIGCGLGGLDWYQVRPMIVLSLSTFCDVELFES